MPRIKIKDLPKDMTISKEDMKKVTGGDPGYGRIGQYLSNPWVLSGVVATAIAIPLAIDNADDRKPES
ncbi:MAG: hypothetical protein JRI95_05405 [Deltaproteobacteria bacterium]|nr:hypothetical protein [Deltaproteobacteria bacterium]MBW2086004.1 hypothetical protein [Deltaproteobacteria bacterium]